MELGRHRLAEVSNGWRDAERDGCGFAVLNVVYDATRVCRARTRNVAVCAGCCKRKPPRGWGGCVGSVPAPAFFVRVGRLMSAESAPRTDAGYYGRANPTLLEQVEPQARRFLELGCGAGGFARAVRARQAVSLYVGMDLAAEALRQAGAALDVALAGNIDRVPVWQDDPGLRQALPLASFDHVVLGDVLEHLYAPQAVMQQAVQYLRPGGSALVCIPNVQHWSVLAQLLAGHWPQTDEGLFDRTHIRWFTLHDMLALLQGCGLSVEKVVPRVFQPEAARPLLQALQPAARLLGVPPGQFEQLALPLQYVLVGRKPGTGNSAA